MKCEPWILIRISGSRSAISRWSTRTTVDVFHGIVVGEAAEVPPADERRRGVAHQADIEGLANPPDERLAKRRPASGDLVKIGAADGIVPRVKFVRRLFDRAYVDVRWKLVVDLAAQLLGIELSIELEVRDLRECVHPGVGPARAV